MTDTFDIDTDFIFVPYPENRMKGRLRFRVLDLMDRTCQVCGCMCYENGYIRLNNVFSMHMTVAHIDPKRPLTFSNITCLCSGCDAERGDNKVEARSLIDAIADRGLTTLDEEEDA